MTKLQDRIKESDLKHNEIAHHLGISEMSLYRKITGQSPIRNSEKIVLCDLLKINLEEFEELRGN